MPSSALETALSGQNLGHTPQKPKNTVSKTVYNELEKQLEGKVKKLNNMKENAADAGMEGLQAVETAGTNFVYSMAKGAWGDEKLKIGSVRVGGVIGLGLVGWGLYDALTGDGGKHQIGFGMGFLTSDITDLGREAGGHVAEAWKKKDEKKDQGSTSSSGTPPAGGAAASQDKPPAAVDLNEPKIHGPLRELEVGRDRSQARQPMFHRRREQQGQQEYLPTRVRVLDLD